MRSHSLAVKATLLLCSSLIVMSGATISPSLPQMSQVFGGGERLEFLSKLILTIPALFIALTSPYAGRFIDRHGRIRLLTLALLLYAVAGSTGLYLDSIWGILVGRAVLGIAVGAIMTTATTLVADYFDGEERKRYLGLQGTFMGLGGVVFVGAGGLLADLSWRAPFSVYFISLLLIVPVWLHFEEPKGAGKADAPENLPQLPPAARLGPTIYGLYLLAFGGMICFYMLPVQAPFLFQAIGVENSSLVGGAIAAATLCGATSSFFYSRIKSHLSYLGVYVLVFGFMAAGYLMLGRAQDYTQALAAMMVSGLGFGLMMPNGNLWLMSLAPPAQRGRIMGGLATFLFLGQFLSPLAVLPLVAWGGLKGAFAMAGALMGLAALGFLVGVWQQSRRRLAT